MRGPTALIGPPQHVPPGPDSDRVAIGAPSWLTSLVAHSLLLAAAVMVSRTGGCEVRAGRRGHNGSGPEMQATFGGHAFETGRSPDRFESFPVEATSAAPFAAPPAAPDLHGEVRQPSIQTVAAVKIAAATVAPAGVTPIRSREDGAGYVADAANAAGERATSPFGAAAGRPTGRPGETSLFGIAAAGGRFVYVVDASSSMAERRGLERAKAELQASLVDLGPTQQFQVIFSSSVQQITLDAGGRTLFSGIDIHRQAVARQIAAISPDGGTDHRQALLAALTLRPDVLYYISDGGEPLLHPRDLQDIRRASHGSRIHCIQFGSGALLAGSQADVASRFMQLLAAQNGGQYVYYDLQ